MEKLQPAKIEEYFIKKEKKIFDEFGWTGDFRLCAKDIIDMLIDFECDGKKAENENSNCNKPLVSKSFCSCEKPKYNYPEMIWCDNCGLEIKD